MIKSVMILDGNLDTCSTIETILRKNDYNVIIAKNNLDCLKKLKIHKPNLLLIPSMASKENILESVVKIKGLKIVYLVTDESEMENLKLYKNVLGFINEPRDIHEFLEKIKKILS
jgi:DNA-binding response OmpR family regulator